MSRFGRTFQAIRQARQSANARSQFLRHNLARSQSILASKARNVELRRLDRHQISLYKINHARKNIETVKIINAQRAEFISNIADFLDSVNENNQKRLEINVNLPQGVSRGLADGAKKIQSQSAISNYGQILDIDNNAIYFDAYGSPYIILNDYETLTVYRVFVDLYAARITDESRLPECTLINPDGKIDVIVSKIAPSLTPGGSFEVIRSR